MQNSRIVIITGLSGSGKSTALRALEDIGFFCVDNLPIALLPKFLELRLEASAEITKTALVMDMREKDFLKLYPEIFKKLKKRGYRLEILFLEASDEMLLRRFSQTRRQHPLAEQDSVLAAIKEEREQLADLKEIATKVVDTSLFNVHQLREFVREHFSKGLDRRGLSVHLVSFGYKYGLPYDADLVVDVRFLPNPYFVPELHDLSGLDVKVADFVLRNEESQEFLKKFRELLDYLIPLYTKEGKSHLTIAVGCTGGRHRSVCIANQLANMLNEKGNQVTLDHRDIQLDRGK